jgi:hypothetical protein
MLKYIYSTISKRVELFITESKNKTKQSKLNPWIDHNDKGSQE